jgi:hypothetical protein
MDKPQRLGIVRLSGEHNHDEKDSDKLNTDDLRAERVARRR